MTRGLAGALLGAVLLAACSEKPAATPTVASTPPYELIELAAVAGRDERWLDGRVEGVNQAIVSAQTAGEVVAVMRDMGDRAAAFEVVLRLRGVQQQAGLQQAEAGFNEAQARATEAATRLARIRALFERKAVARATLDEAVAAHDSAQARVAAARAAVSAAREGVAYAAVVAPFAGVITDRFVSPGTIVAPGSALFGIAGTDRLRVVTDLPERFADIVRTRQEVDVLVDGQRIRAQAPVVQPRASDTGAVGLRVDVPPGVDGLHPGMVVKLAVATGAAQPLRIPVASVVERGEVTGVYLFEASSGRTSFRQVRLGRRLGDEIDVLAGLKSGDTIARDPAVALRHLTSLRVAQ